MTERSGADARWTASWQDAREQLIESTLSATPAQRLAWLEEMLEIAHRAGALGSESAARRSGLRRPRLRS